MRTACSSSCRGGSASVHAGIDPLDVDLETPQPDPPQLPPWMLAWRPPSQILLNFPLGCGPGDPPQIPPWVWAWKSARHAGIPPPPPRPAARHGGIPPAMHAGTPPP